MAAARPETPINLSEAARRYAALGRGPSRKTLSRDAAAGLLDYCADHSRPRTLYLYRSLCSHYGIDPDAPPTRAAAKGAAQQGVAAHQSCDLGPVRAEIDALGTRIGALQATLDNLVRTVAALAAGQDAARKTLMLKYDAEATQLRQRATVAEEALRKAGSLDGLSREMAAMRQAVARLEQRLPAPDR